MIFATCLDIGRGLDFRQVDRNALDADPARLDHQILPVEPVEIFVVPFTGQVGHVAVPVKQVERRRFLPQQIIVDDIIPDKVAPAPRLDPVAAQVVQHNPQLNAGLVNGAIHFPLAVADIQALDPDCTETVDDVTDTADDADDGFDDWGLLGLLGLLGLGGLFRRPQPVVHDTRRTGFASASDRIDNTGL